MALGEDVSIFLLGILAAAAVVGALIQWGPWKCVKGGGGGSSSAPSGSGGGQCPPQKRDQKAPVADCEINQAFPNNATNKKFQLVTPDAKDILTPANCKQQCAGKPDCTEWSWASGAKAGVKGTCTMYGGLPPSATTQATKGSYAGRFVE